MAAAAATKGLLQALLAFQAECPTLPKDGYNPHFKSRFTPLDTVVETVRPLLAKHGLTWSTFPTIGADGQPTLSYRLSHAESGEVATAEMPLLLSKQDPQGLGSAITYARRYSICAVLNLVADEDDDGNVASRPQQAPVQPPKPVELSPVFIRTEKLAREVYATVPKDKYPQARFDQVIADLRAAGDDDKLDAFVTYLQTLAPEEK